MTSGEQAKLGLECPHSDSRRAEIRSAVPGIEIRLTFGLICPDCDWLIEAVGPAWRCER